MMTFLFQFARILAVCFAAEGLAALLPLPIPSSVYGLILMLLALKLRLIKLDQVKQASAFLIGILPLLFLPSAAGVMELWEELRALLVPCLIAVIPITLLVMGASGRVTQLLRRKGGENRD